MYGYLVWKDNNSINTLLPKWMQYMDFQTTTLAEKTQLEEQALTAFNKACPAKDPVRQLLKIEDVKSLFSRIHPADQSLAIALWLAHHRLPRLEREARTATIERIVADHFGSVAQEVNLQGPLSLLKTFGTLLADAMLETDLRGQGALVLMPVLEQNDDEMEKLQLPLIVGMNLIKDLPKEAFVARQQLVWQLICTRMANQREAALNQILALFKKNRSQLLVDAKIQAEKLAEPLPRTVFFDALAEMVAHAVASETLSNAEIVDAHLGKANAIFESLKNRVAITTIEAVLAGVDLGDRTDSSRAALLDCNRQLQLQNRQRTRDAARIARARKTGVPIQLTPEQQAETATLQAWPLQQLAQWIEGPITEKRQASGPINRKDILKRELAALPTQKNKPQPQPTAAVDALTAEDVDTTIQQALAATAGYFLAEIGDLLVLAKPLQAHPELVAACSGLTDELARLANTPGLPKEATATALFVKAEAAIRALRAGLKSAESSARLQTEFGQALMAALRAETLVLGKRQGGKVACPVHAEDWTFVCNTFHDRWLPQVTSIGVDGMPVQLQTNQAVALYVTGSSQSGYAFDVSVHLWQRRQGRLTKPSDEAGLLPAMNHTDWFDTYATCCVLHVPSAD